MSLKQTLKKIPGVMPVVRTVKCCKTAACTIPGFLAERRIKRTLPIRVGFLCQYLPAWAKVKSVYHMMEQDPRFEPLLICIPDDIMDHEREDPDSLENPIYDYQVTHGYPNAINGLIGKSQYLDLKALDLEYVFFPRPYNRRMPRQYHSSVVSRYSKLCMIMYGMAFSDSTLTTLNVDFMRNVYCYFSETPYTKRIHKRNTAIGHALKLQKSVCLGMPVLEALSLHKDETSPSYAFSKNDFRVIWTPRWTTDKKEGGSNFFTFYQWLLDYAEAHPDVDLLLRPHPLTFTNFVETGEMTQEEVDAYRARCAAIANVSLDAHSQYEATLWNSSVMISDISSIMPEFLITGKPLIFCTGNMELTLTPFALRMVEACYSVKDEDELLQTLEMLRSGSDPKKDLRQQIVRELFGDKIEGATARIVEELAQGHR